MTARLAARARGTTIAAIASPPGPGARGIVRLSGPRTRAIVRAAWCGEPPELAARALVAGRIDDGTGTQPCLLLWMPGPRSYTGDDVAELHVPGSPPLVAAALARCLALGATPAQPGEFTRRAFESGRIDLLQAEGVLALVQAEDAAEARAARGLLFGGLRERVAELRDALDDLRALVEASLDFDEADTGHVDPAEIRARADRCRALVAAALGFEAARARTSGVPRIVLCGAPNAGKSALYNRLCGRADAIVSPVPGTTRDALSTEIRLGARSVRLVDTPGADDLARGIEREAQVRAQERLATADVLVWVFDPVGSDVARLAAAPAGLPSGVPVILAWNKIDLAGAAPPPAPTDPAVLASGCTAVAAISARTGAGCPQLVRAILAAIDDPAHSHGRVGVAREVAERHAAALERAAAELERGLTAWSAGAPLELLAEHLRGATAGLDALSGSTTSEDLLDRIFARFCLGK